MALLDTYSVRARLFPAILGIAPAIAFLLASIAISFEQLGLPQVIVTAAVGVLFVGFADLARRFGRRAEKDLFGSTGGRPFPTVLRHRDDTLPTESKAEYAAFLAKQIKTKAPTAAEEEANPNDADQFYLRAGDWLRERTRDRAKYGVLFEENVTYGNRRNLYGIKWFGLGLNMAVVAVSCALIFVQGSDVIAQYGMVLVIAALHAIWFLLVVTRKSVLDASDLYGRQLVLSLETLVEAEGGAKKGK